MNHDGSPSHSQKPTTGPHRETVQFSPVHIFTPSFSKTHSNILLPSMPRSFKQSLYLRLFNWNCVHISLLQSVSDVVFIPSF